MYKIILSYASFPLTLTEEQRETDARELTSAIVVKKVKIAKSSARNIL
jgi:hypothetical protein